MASIRIFRWGIGSSINMSEVICGMDDGPLYRGRAAREQPSLRFQANATVHVPDPGNLNIFLNGYILFTQPQTD